MTSSQTLFSPRTRLRLAWACLLVHLAAVLFTLTTIAPGVLPDDVAARRAHVANASSAWSVGWAAWALASVALISLFAAWVDTLERKWWGWLAVGVTLVGGLIDWLAEAVWIFLAPGWAARAAFDPVHERLYAQWERAYQIASIGGAHMSYCLGGLILTAVSRRTSSFPRWLARSSLAFWGASLALSYAGFAGRTGWMDPIAAAVFGSFLVWLALIGHGWLRARHPLPASGAIALATSFRETLRAMVPKHPIPMKTIFRDCFLANFATDAEVMRRLLPPSLEPALHRGSAFLSVVIANMERMRPAFLPRALGVTYNQVVYRAVVRCGDEAGVHFLRSDADSRLMSLAGDWLTFFRFHRARMSCRRDGGLAHFDLRARPGDRADIRASFDLTTAGPAMPPTSRFGTLAEARSFLVDLFAAFAQDPLTGEVSTVRIRRGEWKIEVVEDRRASYELMEDSRLFPPGSAHLDSIFYVREIPYRWGTLETHRSASR